MDALTIARACADAMWADDVASRALGMEFIAVEPGHAVLAMSVTEAMVNGHDLCHGGYIFMLADSAFAFACNTYNQRRSPSIARSRSSPRRGAATGSWRRRRSACGRAAPASMT